MKLYIFNPDTDLALANNSENYIPSARVKQMQKELEMLPMWYAEPGSAILVSGTTDIVFTEKAKKLFGIETTFVPSEHCTLPPESEILPWGWNPTLRKKLLNIGISEQLLPSTKEMNTYRELSGRANDVRILDGLHTNSLFTAEIINSAEECNRYATTHPRCIFKAPWSGSGKGLLWCYGKYDNKSEGWCKRVLREQGYVVATPIYEKVQDFAMEYLCDGKGGISFIGYSLFDTNTKGAYNGNLLQSDTLHRKLLSQYIPLSAIDDTDRELRTLLPQAYKGYKGYIGVDMMACRTEDDSYALHPCVEINMRMNMGVLCSILTKRFIAGEKKGRFAIEYYPAAEELKKEYARMCAEHPLVIADGRIESGFMPLVPVTSENNYMAYVIIEAEK